MNDTLKKKLDVEIWKYKMLLQQSAYGGVANQREIHRQASVLSSLGLNDGDILNLIHDRHGRASIRVEKSERRKANIPRAREDDGPRGSFGKRERVDATSYVSYVETYKHKKGTSKKELSILYGLNTYGRIVHSDYATQGTQYECPACRSPLNLRISQTQKKAYFTHKPNTTCTLDSIRIATARHLIAKVIAEHADPAANVLITLDCQCAKCAKSIQRELPNTIFTHARVKDRVGGIEWDVVALRDKEPVLAVSVQRINRTNTDQTGEVTVPWIELNPLDVLKNPYHWVPSQGQLKSVRCASCRSHQGGA